MMHIIAYLNHSSPRSLEYTAVRFPQFVALLLFRMVVREEQVARSKKNRNSKSMAVAVQIIPYMHVPGSDIFTYLRILLIPVTERLRRGGA